MAKYLHGVLYLRRLNCLKISCKYMYRVCNTYAFKNFSKLGVTEEYDVYYGNHCLRSPFWDIMQR